MTPLRQAMIDAMPIRGFAVRTQRRCLSAVEALAKHYQGSLGVSRRARLRRLRRLAPTGKNWPGE